MSATPAGDLVQPIAVFPSSHQDTVAAVALASALSLGTAALTEAPWSTWLGSAFTKSVRKIKTESGLDKIRELALSSVEIIVGGAVAIAFEPMTYEDFPKELRRLQVSGLDVPRSDDPTDVAEGVSPAVVELNTDAAMSTGKAAAQAAHALCGWLLVQDTARWSQWLSEPGLDLREASFSTPHEHRSFVDIVDHGRTEVEPGTSTARAYLD